MIYEYFKVGETDESVLDVNEICKVEMKNDNVQSFNTRWDETIIVMKKQPDGEILENLFYRHFQQSEQRKPLLSLYIQDTVQQGESRDCTRLEKMVSDTWRKLVRKHFLLVEDSLKARFWRCCSKGQVSGQRKKETVESAYSGQLKVNALDEKSVE